jgi:glycosyltransferase involved in cell wall biosynthesis
LAAAVEANGVDCLFTINEVPRGQRVPVMTWIPDFQHVSLPEMFTEEDIRGRDRMFREAAERADRIILSSEDARRQYEAFAPWAGGKSSVVPFTAHFEPSSFARSPEAVVAELHLPEKYFFLPNQFWRHKNHELVIEAVRLAKQEVPGIAVVCTGNTNDYRHPRYFGTLLAALSRAGVREQMLVVGLVERHEVHQLMRQALAVVQPSRFEGWSTTVEEAKAIGRPLLLSDLPVHREQAPEGTEFFGVGDAAGLARLLVKGYRELEAGPDLVAERAARLRSVAAAMVHGEAFLAAAMKACGRAA